MAWRLVAARRSQSALLLAAIAVPVAIGVVASTVVASATPTPSGFARELAGDADALVHLPADDASGIDALRQAGADLSARLPPGSFATLEIEVPNAVLSSDAASAGVQGRVADPVHPLQQPRLDWVEGDAASLRDGDIALSVALAVLLGVSAGDSIGFEGEARRLAVGAVVRHPRDLRAHFFVLPHPRSPRSGLDLTAVDLGAGRWLVALPPDAEPTATWERLESSGYRIESRSALEALARPRPLADPAAVAVAVVLLLEVALFAAAAFALEFRRLYRQLGLLGCVGASRRFQRRWLRAYCGFFGLFGGLAGVLLGWLASVPAVWRLSARAGEVWDAPIPPPVALLALLGTAVLVALAAGALPARAVTRLRALELLRTADTPWQRLPTGFALISAALAVGSVAALGRLAGGAASPVVVVLVAVVGLAASLGVVTAVVAANRSRFGMLPPAVRIALRSLFAAPLRAWFLLCGIGAIVGAAAAFVLPLQSAVTNSLSTHIASAPLGSALVATNRPLTEVERSGMAAELDADIGQFRYAAVPTSDGARQARVLTDFLRCSSEVAEPARAFETCRQRTGEANHNGWLGVAEPDALPVLLGRRLGPDGIERYRSGAVVLATPRAAQAGTVTFTYEDIVDREVRYPAVAQADAVVAGATGDYVEVPVAFVHPAAAGGLGLTIFVPETGLGDGLARRPASVMLVVPQGGRLLDQGEVRRALPGDVAPASSVLVERGPWLSDAMPRVLRVAVALTVAASAGAILVAISLWLNSMHADYLMLGAVGATRRWRRRTGMWSGLVLAAVPTLVALAWGIAAGWTFTRGQQVPVVVPWRTYAALVALVLAVGPWLGSRVVPRHAKPLRHTS